MNEWVVATKAVDEHGYPRYMMFGDNNGITVTQWAGIENAQIWADKAEAQKWENPICHAVPNPHVDDGEEMSLI